MEKSAVSFQARARTIDHLGKGQIADAPTAISELWKNSYDAYARDVALHLFDGDLKTGAIIDNGCGMTFQQLIESWLVIGTESKSQKRQLPDIDRFGLAVRTTQGEKGIGRLSTAFLSPVTLLITKKIDSDFSVALIDWRFFENPYLSLHDIVVPMTEIVELSDLEKEVPDLLLQLKGNLKLLESSSSVRAAWARYSNEQLEGDESITLEATTEGKIIRFCEDYQFDEKVLETWLPLLGKTQELDGGIHGTALILVDLTRELSLITNSGDLAKKDHELEQIELAVVDTLRSFYNPYERNEDSLSYEIKAFQINDGVKDILRQHDVFTRDDFDALEHKVEGIIDCRGWFKGRVTAFGKDLGDITLTNNINLSAGSKAGEFRIKLGTFEHDKGLSSLSASQIDSFETIAAKHSGLLIFRDNLRVLPYGRTDNDFFQVEERRGKSAGRYFFANRRLFGQILLTHEENNQLKDKAGREGFVKNQASREFRSIVEGVLVGLADKYFGRKSEDRKVLLAIVKKEKAQQKEAQTKARRMTQKTFISSLDEQTPILDEKSQNLKELVFKVDSDASGSNLNEWMEELEGLESERTRLKTPSQPPKLGKHEDKYRQYRDAYSEFSELVKVTSEKLNKLNDLQEGASKLVKSKKRFDRNQALLNSQVNKYSKGIFNKLSTLEDLWHESSAVDRKTFHEQAVGLIDEVTENSNIPSVLNSLDAIYMQLSDDYAVKYNGIIKALDRLENGINLEFAFSIAEEEKTYFEEKASQLQSLAQLGISVEVLAHEIEAQDGLVTRGLNSLPSETKKHPGFVTAMNAHKALTAHIRFLSPLKLSGYQARQEISGKDIQTHIMKFFRDRFERQRVDLQVSEEFLDVCLRDLPSRIYPVFINILNNALYWVCLGDMDKRAIKIGLIGDEVVIANSGPPVDVDDSERIFDLFTTKRANGHGVGLYLCKENLAVAHHKIRYSSERDIKLIEDGANFVISFNGLEILP